MTSLRHALPLVLPLTLIVIAGVLSVVAQLFIFSDPTTPDDWERAAKALSPQLTPDDAILIDPVWNHAALPALYDVSSQIIRAESLTPHDLQPYDAIWLLTQSDRQARALTRLPFDASSAAERAREFGSVSLLRVPIPQDMSWREHLTSRERLSQLSFTRNGSTCDRWNGAAKSWACFGTTIRVEQRELGLAPRPCLWLPSPKSSEPITLKIPVQSAESKQLHLRVGQSLLSARKHDRGPIRWEVSMGDGNARRELARGSMSPMDASMHTYDVDLPTSASRGHLVLRYWVERAHPGKGFCFDAWVS